jgi:hypothetical protein
MVGFITDGVSAVISKKRTVLQQHWKTNWQNPKDLPVSLVATANLSTRSVRQKI